MSGTSAILIGFNAGDYETIDLSPWIAVNPKEVLATNFSKPTEAFGKFLDPDVFIAGQDGA
jgi:oxalate decarboxylase